MNFILSIAGLLGGLMCACADMLLDLKGKDNVKYGSKKILDSNWVKMPDGRFAASIILAMLAVPLYSMGIISLSNQIGVGHPTLGSALKLSIFVGAMGGFFIHALVCVIPVIYKEIMLENRFELADRVVTRVFKTVRIPFGLLYLTLMLVPSLLVCYAIVAGYLSVPLWFILLNPIAFQILGWILRAVKKEWFYEMPSICMASLGLSMFGVIGLVNLAALS